MTRRAQALPTDGILEIIDRAVISDLASLQDTGKSSLRSRSAGAATDAIDEADRTARGRQALPGRQSAAILHP